VAITSPYDPEVTAAGRAFLESNGITVTGEACRSFDDETGISGQAEAFWAEAAKAANSPDAEAVVLMGGGLRTGGSVARLEAQLCKPVIAAPAALVWHACSLLGIEATRPRLGRLFGAPARPGSIARHLSSGTKVLSVMPDPPVFGWGKGTRLFDTQGRAYLDFACGSGTSVLGHAHPEVLRALAEQAATGILHLGPHFLAPVQIRLMERLAEVLGPPLTAFHPGHQRHRGYRSRPEGRDPCHRATALCLVRGVLPWPDTGGPLGQRGQGAERGASGSTGRHHDPAVSGRRQRAGGSSPPARSRPRHGRHCGDPCRAGAGHSRDADP
jgi:hypothetical protein